MTPEHKKLNLGCGFNKIDDHWNVDIEPRCNPDQVVDLNITPWPFEDNFFTHITADNILEHVGQTPQGFTNVMKELYRISAPGASWFVRVPHHRCDLFWDDYTHVRVLTAKTFQMFDQAVNVKSIQDKFSDSTFGLYHDIDIELTNVDYNIVDLWRRQQQEGMLGFQELNIKLNTLANVAETLSIFLKVHKPGRFENWLRTNVK